MKCVNLNKEKGWVDGEQEDDIIDWNSRKI